MRKKRLTKGRKINPAELKGVIATLPIPKAIQEIINNQPKEGTKPCQK